MGRKIQRSAFGTVRKRKGRRGYYIRFHVNGRPFERYGGTTKRLALLKLAAIQQELERAEIFGYEPTEEVRFEEFVPRFLRHAKTRLADSTYLRDRGRLRSTMIPWFRGRILSEVSKRDIERFLLHRAEQGLSVATRNRDLSLLSSFFKLAVTLHAARENPTSGIKRPKEQERAVPFLSVEEQNHLIQFCPPRIQDLVATAIDTGCREGELLKLEWKDVNLKRGVVTLRRSKNKTVRVVQLTSRARQRLKARRRRRTIPLEGPDLVFHELPGYMDHYSYKLYKRAAARVGHEDLTFHDLRHVCAVNLIRAGVSLPDIKAWLGHKSMAMVFRYAGHVPEDSGILALQRLEVRLAKAKIAES